MLEDYQTRVRIAGAGPPWPVVVANADDPLVAAAVMPLTADSVVDVVWVAAGQLWTADASSCARCAVPWSGGPDYCCPRCEFARPTPAWGLEGHELVGPDGLRRSLMLSLPGRANRANAVLAVAAASQWGIEVDAALEAIRAITHVGGRFATMSIAGVEARLLLAKNPAGWQEMLADGVQAPRDRSPVLALLVLNAQGPDGRDTSWIWDVSFEELGGRWVVVSGERAQDLAVRLRYAEVDFVVCADPLDAIMLAARPVLDRPPRVDVIANYTAFTGLRARLGAPDRA